MKKIIIEAIASLIIFPPIWWATLWEWGSPPVLKKGGKSDV